MSIFKWCRNTQSKNGIIAFYNQILEFECFGRSSIEQCLQGKDKTPLWPTKRLETETRSVFLFSLVKPLFCHRLSRCHGTHCLGEYVISHFPLGFVNFPFPLRACLHFNNHWCSSSSFPLYQYDSSLF